MKTQEDSGLAAFFLGRSTRSSGLVRSKRPGAEAQAEQHGCSPSKSRIHALFSVFNDPLAAAERMQAQRVKRAMLPAFVFTGRGGLDRLAEFGEYVEKQLANA